MEFKKKLKFRLYIAITYIVLGLIMIAAGFITKLNSDYLSSFGLILTVLGIVRIRNYFFITKNEETIRKREIAETDERTISIMYKAKNAAFNTYIIICGSAVIILSLLNMHNEAKWISYSVCLLLIIYWISYLIYQKKS